MSTSVVLAGTPAYAHSPATPGAAGAGDPYYPLDGNGGYDVKHYDLAITYAPASDALAGVVQIRARATQRLSAFNLDLDGLTIRSVTVDGRAAKWSRDGTELTVTPRRSLDRGHVFDTRIIYDGVPKVIHDPSASRAATSARCSPPGSTHAVEAGSPVGGELRRDPAGMQDAIFVRVPGCADNSTVLVERIAINGNSRTQRVGPLHGCAQRVRFCG